ncbi:MAG: DUF3592 domain-containing protein [Pseudomonadota bacterium]
MKQSQQEHLADELRALSGLAEFSAALAAFKGRLDLDDEKQRRLLNRLHSILTGGEVQEALDLLMERADDPLVLTVRTYLEARTHALAQVEHALRDSDTSRVLFARLQSCLDRGRVEEAVAALAGARPGGTFFERWFLVGILLPFILWFGVGGVLDLIRASRSLTWPTAQGQILSSRVRHESSSSRTGGGSFSADRSRSGGTQRTEVYWPEVIYTYSAQHQEYRGERVAETQYDDATAAGAVQRYPAGRRVQVRYNPDDPTVALLEPGIQGGTLTGLWLAGGFLAVALVSKLFPLLRRRSLAQARRTAERS